MKGWGVRSRSDYYRITVISFHKRVHCETPSMCPFCVSRLCEDAARSVFETFLPCIRRVSLFLFRVLTAQGNHGAWHTALRVNTKVNNMHHPAK
jgi:hypothetical protein